MIPFVDGISENIIEELVAPALSGIMYMRIRFVILTTMLKEAWTYLQIETLLKSQVTYFPLLLPQYFVKV